MRLSIANRGFVVRLVATSRESCALFGVSWGFSIDHFYLSDVGGLWRVVLYGWGIEIYPCWIDDSPRTPAQWAKVDARRARVGLSPSVRYLHPALVPSRCGC